MSGPAAREFALLLALEWEGSLMNEKSLALLADIRAAFAAHPEFRPAKGRWFSKEPGGIVQCCAMAAPYLHANGLPFLVGAAAAGSIVRWVKETYGVSDDFVTGFVYGFDGRDESNDSDGYFFGNSAGRTIRNELLSRESAT